MITRKGFITILVVLAVVLALNYLAGMEYLVN
jgi:hypothetical protein